MHCYCLRVFLTIGLATCTTSVAATTGARSNFVLAKIYPYLLLPSVVLMTREIVFLIFGLIINQLMRQQKHSHVLFYVAQDSKQCPFFYKKQILVTPTIAWTTSIIFVAFYFYLQTFLAKTSVNIIKLLLTDLYFIQIAKIQVIVL